MSDVIPEQVDLRKYIENRLMSGRPHIRGRRVPVWMIAGRENTQSIAQIAEDFSITETEVLAALLYYREHQAEIQAQIAEDERLFEEGYAKQAKKWQRK